MRRRTTAALLAVALAAACGGDDTTNGDFVGWATSEGGLDQATAECVEPKLSDSQREALTAIEPDTAEEDIDADAVDAMIAASIECSSEDG